MPTESTQIRFIGGGNMVHSLIGGLIAKGHRPDQIAATDPDSTRCQTLRETFGIAAHTDNTAAFGMPDVVILSVKPQVMPEAVRSIRSSILDSQPLILSIAAGVRIDQIERWLDSAQAIVRTMPNTPSLIGLGATGLFANERVTSAQKQLAEQIMESVGLTVWVDEETQLNAVTALSGSGPAYFFYLLEAMQEAGHALGLADDVVTRLVEQTGMGATRLAQQSDDSFSTLRRKVTSPNGTTERALQHLQQAGFNRIIVDAIEAASKRSSELSSEFDGPDQGAGA